MGLFEIRRIKIRCNWDPGGRIRSVALPPRMIYTPLSMPSYRPFLPYTFCIIALKCTSEHTRRVKYRTWTKNKAMPVFCCMLSSLPQGASFTVESIGSDRGEILNPDRLSEIKETLACDSLYHRLNLQWHLSINLFILPSTHVFRANSDLQV